MLKKSHSYKNAVRESHKKRRLVQLHGRELKNLVDQVDQNTYYQIITLISTHSHSHFDPSRNRERPSQQRATSRKNMIWVEATRIRAKYPDRIPVIVEKAKKSDIPSIDKKNNNNRAWTSI
ncbi:hypothetical protein UlMin_013564 [Ulmus minor]